MARRYGPQKSQGMPTNTRIGFNVASVGDSLEVIQKLGVSIVSPAKDSQWGRRAVVRDLDGHTVELVTPQPREQKTQMQHAPENG